LLEVELAQTDAEPEIEGEGDVLIVTTTGEDILQPAVLVALI
jgi:hypothetical protein